MEFRDRIVSTNDMLVCTILSFCFLLCACGSNQSSGSSGSLSFGIAYKGAAVNARAPMAALDCVGQGIAQIEARVYDSGGNLLKNGGPWSCADGQGSIDAVPAGANRTVVVIGNASGGEVVMRGDKAGITVTAGQTSSAGTITCYAFAPTLLAPVDLAAVEAGYISLEWSAVSGATSYDVLASENSDLSDAVIDVNTTQTTYPPSELSNTKTYYWQVTARDAQGNAGASEVWSFVAKAWLSAAAGWDHTVAVKPGGTLWTWGHNDSGQLGLGDTDDRTSPTQVGTETDWAVVAVGADFTVALKSNGTLWAWGGNEYGQLGLDDNDIRYSPTQVGIDANWAIVSAAGGHTMAVKSNGTLWAWGANEVGQLGLGDTISRNTPTQVEADNNWAFMDAGSGYTMAMKDDGTLWAWGGNHYGQLGLGDTTSRNTPTQVGVATDWGFVAAGKEILFGEVHTMAVKSDGTLWAWGSNYNGQLGLGETGSESNRFSPEQAGNDTDWTFVAAGTGHSVAVKTNGSLWACGRNDKGQLGNGDTVLESSLVQVGSDTDWELVSAGSEHNIAVKQNGELYAWGLNANGQLGNGTSGQKSRPSQVGTDTNWASVSAGTEHTLAIKTNGQLWACGNNDNGALGTGTTESLNTITQIGTQTNWAVTAAGGIHSMAVKSNGTLWAWGDNYYGQLGLGDDGYGTGRDTPEQVGSDSDWAFVAADFYHTVAIKTNGELWAWGYNSSGQLGLGDTTARNTPTQVGVATDWALMAAGTYHTLAVKTNGTLWAWGDNSDGQLGLGDTTYRNTPTQVGDATDWTLVAAGNYHTVAVKTNGTLWAWGDSDSGQLGLGDVVIGPFPSPTMVVDADWEFVSAYASYTVAVKSSGTLWAWGDNDHGQLGIGDLVDRPRPVRVGNDSEWETAACGSDYTMAVKGNGTLWAWGDNNEGQLGDGTAWQTQPVHIE